MRHHTTRKITFLKFYTFTNIFWFWKLIQAMKNMDPENGKHKWKPKKTWSFRTLNKWYLVINTIHYNTMHGIHIVYVPGITKNSTVNIQQPSILLKVFFFRDSFCNIFEDFQNVFEKHLCWSAFIEEEHYLNKIFCNIDFNNFWKFFSLCARSMSLYNWLYFLKQNLLNKWYKSFEKYSNQHCLKSLLIRSFSGLYLARMRENTDQKNSECGRFSRIAKFENGKSSRPFSPMNKKVKRSKLAGAVSTKTTFTSECKKVFPFITSIPNNVRPVRDITEKVHYINFLW